MLADNCLIFSAKGYGNSNMAGGDYDGDLAMVVFNESLVKLVQVISEAIPSYGLGGELKKKLKEELGEMVPLTFDADDGFSQRARVYHKFGLQMRNLEIRGCMTAQAEKCCLLTLNAPDEIKQNETLRRQYILRACSFGYCTHFATDCLKQLNAKQVHIVANRLTTECGGLSYKAEARSSVHCSVALRLFPDHVLKKEFLEAATTCLEAATGTHDTFCRYWLPKREYVLGFAAGRLVARYLHTVPVGDFYNDRSAVRTVFGELACLIRHRCGNELLSLAGEDTAEAFEAVLRSCHKRPLRTFESLDRSWHS